VLFVLRNSFYYLDFQGDPGVGLETGILRGFDDIDYLPQKVPDIDYVPNFPYFGADSPGKVPTIFL